MQRVQSQFFAQLQQAGQFLLRFDVLFWVYVAASVAVSLTEYFKGVKPLYGDHYFHYNNYIIFKESFFNLLSLKDLYAAHPDLHFDLYKYSPTFALFMAPMAILPDIVGLTIWNTLNAIPVYFVVRALPELSERRRSFILWIILVDVMTSMHNAQSNGLMLALLVMAFVCFERQKIVLAALCLVATVFIKLFGVVAFMMFLLYPKRIRFVIWAIGWTALLAVLPVVVVPWDYLISMYRSWLALLLWDQGAHHGLSIFGLLIAWFNMAPAKLLILCIGVVLQVLPLLRRETYRSALARWLLFSSALLWMIVFNHKAESATFLIAMFGIALWYFVQPADRFRTVLLLLSFLLISLSPTDLFPSWLRTYVVAPYELKALPAVIVWVVILRQLLTVQPDRGLPEQARA